MNLLLTALLFVFCTAFLADDAEALEISIDEMQLGPFGKSVWIRLSGEFSRGDSERLERILDRVTYNPSKTINFEFDSSGGSVAEAMKIGRIISGLPHGVTTTVGGEGISNQGECASACVLAFVGGHYRFTGNGKLGVHQFFFRGSDLISGDQATSISQVMSADIVSYLQEMRVDPNFFKVMASTSSNSIFWVPDEVLTRHRVINREIYDERDEYKNAQGFFYLLMWQQSRYGENKMVIGCDEGSNPFMVAYLQPPESYMNGRFQIRIDGVSFDPESWDIVREGRWVEILFMPTPDQLQRIQKAKNFGARMLPPEGQIFFGFEKRVQDNKLHDILAGCNHNGRSTPLTATTSASGSMIDASDTDLPGGDLLKMGIKGISYADCKKICISMPDCKAVTWVRSNQWCWPKSEVTQSFSRAGMMSAMKQ